MIMFFFFKQKTAYEMRISDWSSDVCSSDLRTRFPRVERHEHGADRERAPGADRPFGIVAHGDGDAVALADAQPVGQGAAKGARGAPMGLERPPLLLIPQQVAGAEAAACVEQRAQVLRPADIAATSTPADPALGHLHRGARRVGGSTPRRK